METKPKEQRVSAVAKSAWDSWIVAFVGIIGILCAVAAFLIGDIGTAPACVLGTMTIIALIGVVVGVASLWHATKSLLEYTDMLEDALNDRARSRK